jgi:hypothetical protein
LVARFAQFVARRSRRSRRLPRVHGIDSHRTQEPTMTHRIDILIQRATALTLAAVVTLAMLGGIDGLARGDVAADALLAHQSSAARA